MPLLRPSLALLLLSIAGSGCYTPITPPAEINSRYEDVLRQRLTTYHLKPGDLIEIATREGSEGLAELNVEGLTVLEDGRCDFFLLGNHRVAGRPIEDLEDRLEKAYREKQQDRPVDILVKVTPTDEYVYIGGEFERFSGAQVVLEPRMTVQQLIAMYNTTKITGDTDYAQLRRPHSEDPLHPEMEFFRIDLTDDTEDIYLLPGDQLTLERNYLAGVINYLREYIFGVFPFSGLFAPLLTGI